MIYLQVQKRDIPTGESKILFSIETKTGSKTFMTNELHLMYDDQATETTEIKVVEVNES